MDAASREYQLVQNDLAQLIDNRQKLGSQLAENEAVQQEFARLTDHNTIYKLVGGVLLIQDSTEAKTNVEKRLAFIKAEIERLELKLKETETNLEQKKTELVNLQTDSSPIGASTMPVTT